jgi:hypothetical protein
MGSLQTPTVDIHARDGQRVVLRPVIPLDKIPGTGRAALAVVCVLCGIWLATSFNRLNHTDLWGHLSFGRWIVEHRALPQSDPFRSYVASESFLNVPWLSQVLGYLWYCALGPEGLVFAHALLLAATAGCLMLAVRGRDVSTAWAAAAGGASYVLGLPIVGTLRPQVFGMLGFALTLWAIARLPVRRHPLVWAPLVFVLWANLHGSFPAGLLALACFAVGWSWQRWRQLSRWATFWRDPSVRRAWLALLLCAAACCLNPVGFRLLAAVATFAENTNLGGVSEWRPTVLPSLTGALMLCCFAITAVLLRWTPRRIAAYEVLLLAVFGLAALGAMRMLVWWAALWPWLAAPHAAAVVRLLRPARRMAARPEAQPQCDTAGPEAAAAAARAVASAQTRTFLMAALICVTVMLSPPSYALLTGRHRPEQAVFSADTPYQVAEELVDRQLAGRIVAPMDWADYLIWRTGGAVEPLVYSHVHLTGANLWKDFLSIQSGGPGWLTLADQYGLQYAVVSRARQPQLAFLASQESRCRLRYADQQALLVEILPKSP